MTCYSHIDTILECDEQTNGRADRQTSCESIHVVSALHSIALNSLFMFELRKQHSISSSSSVVQRQRAPRGWFLATLLLSKDLADTVVSSWLSNNRSSTDNDRDRKRPETQRDSTMIWLLLLLDTCRARSYSNNHYAVDMLTSRNRRQRCLLYHGE